MLYMQDVRERKFFIHDKISALVRYLRPDLADGLARYVEALEAGWAEDHLDSLVDDLSQLSVRDLPSVHSPDRWRRCLHVFSAVIELSHRGVSQIEIDPATRRFYNSKSLKNSLCMSVSDLFASIRTCVALITADNSLGIIIRKWIIKSRGSDAQAIMFGLQEVRGLTWFVVCGRLTGL